MNRGFHMGDDYMAIDIELPPGSEKEITWEMAMRAELLANKVIWADAPVTISYFDSREEAEKMPLRKGLAFDEDISIVTIGELPDPYDCVACCGTHPSTAGQVGLIKIFRLEQNKGMTRIYLEAGSRAFADYDKKHKILSDLANHYTTGIDELSGKLAADEAAAVGVRAELAALRRIIIEERADEIRKELEETEADESVHLIVHRYSDLRINDLLHLAKPFTGKTGKLLILVSEKENTLLLTSDGNRYDCGKLIKENAGIYGGKGGGRNLCLEMNVPFLGEVPMEVELMASEDSGKAYIQEPEAHPSVEALVKIAEKLEKGDACTTGRDFSYLGTPGCSPEACAHCSSDCGSRKK